MSPREETLLGPAEIRELAAQLGIRPTKQWGQNFVIDKGTVRRIVRAAEVGPDEVVLEVGPGLGSLTLALLPEVRQVTAVEIDPALAEQLPRTVSALRLSRHPADGHPQVLIIARARARCCTTRNCNFTNGCRITR